jgi:hypothetical protein
MDYGFLNPIISSYMGSGERVFTPLDPIDRTTVGRANLKLMRKWLGDVGRIGVMILLLDLALGVAQPWLEAVHDARPTYVDARYAEHLMQLAEIHLLETSEDLRRRRKTRKHVRCWSGYFAVPKTDVTSRAIFSGGRVSSLCPPPPNVNLMTQPEVLWHIRDMLSRTKGRLHFVECDLRHWFHQIELHQSVRMLFGLQLKDKTWYTWRTAPMGWSWSPSIAQACGWMCLLFQRDTAKEPLFDMTTAQEEGAGLPKFFRTVNKKAIAMVYYDNLLVVSTDANEATRLKATIEKNAKALNVEIKGVVNSSINQVIYLGMDIIIKPTEAGQAEVMVRPSKIEKWAESRLEAEDSCRHYASFVGRAMFMASLVHPNLQLSSIGQRAVKLARCIGKQASRRPWSAVIQQPTGLKALWDDVMRCREGHFACLQRVAAAGTYQRIMATDASTPGYGVTILDSQGRLIESKGGKWGEKKHDLLKADLESHIFYKELRAALYGLTFVPEGQKVLLVVDNAAVAWVLRNGFSRTESANQLLDTYRHLLERIYDVCLVVSADNPADCPSRGVPMEAQRVENLNHAITSHLAGARWASQRNEVDKWVAYRHDEPPEIDGLGPDDDEKEEIFEESLPSV